MRILREKMGVLKMCHNCNSELMVNEEDFVPFVDILCGEINHGAPDLCCRWTCPVCGERGSCWLYELPDAWRSPIRLRMKEEELAKEKLFNDPQRREEFAEKWWYPKRPTADQIAPLPRKWWQIFKP